MKYLVSAFLITIQATTLQLFCSKTKLAELASQTSPSLSSLVEEFETIPLNDNPETLSSTKSSAIYSRPSNWLTTAYFRYCQKYGK